MHYIDNLIERFPSTSYLRSELEQSVVSIVLAAKQGNKIMTCGNGGSAADAEHIVGELMKGFLLKRNLTPQQASILEKAGCSSSVVANLQQGIPAISLVSGVSLPTAFSNDVCYEACFAQQVFVLGNRGDILIGISTSGNSPNVVAAMQVARAKGVLTIALTGKNGGILKNLADILLNVQEENVPLIQELHLPIYHAVCAEVEQKLMCMT